MSFKEKYGLIFSKNDSESGVVINRCSIRNKKFLNLAILNFLDIFHSEYLLEEIDKALDKKAYEHFPQVSDSMDIEISPPAIIIDFLKIPLSDMKSLLEEWMDFCNTNK